MHLLLTHGDNEVVADCCWALSYLTDGSSDRLSNVLDLCKPMDKFVKRICQLLVYVCLQSVILSPVFIKRFYFCVRHSDGSLRSGTLRLVGNIVTGDDSQTDVRSLYLFLSLLLSNIRSLLFACAYGVRIAVCCESWCCVCAGAAARGFEA